MKKLIAHVHKSWANLGEHLTSSLTLFKRIWVKSPSFKWGKMGEIQSLWDNTTSVRGTAASVLFKECQSVFFFFPPFFFPCVDSLSSLFRCIYRVWHFCLQYMIVCNAISKVGCGPPALRKLFESHRAKCQLFPHPFMKRYFKWQYFASLSRLIVVM